MTDVSRRGFITRASVVGVGAAAAVTGLASLTAPADASQRKPAHASEPDLNVDGPAPQDVVIHIRDAKTSEVALIAGTEEYVFHDHRLVDSVLRKFNDSTKE